MFLEVRALAAGGNAQGTDRFSGLTCRGALFQQQPRPGSRLPGGEPYTFGAVGRVLQSRSDGHNELVWPLDAGAGSGLRGGTGAAGRVLAGAERSSAAMTAYMRAVGPADPDQLVE